MKMKQFDAVSIVEHVEALICAVRYDNHEIVFANQKLRALLPECVSGVKCHVVLFGRDSECPDCPMRQVRKNEAVGRTVFIERLGLWLRVDYTDIEDGNAHYCLCFGMDVSQLKASIRTIEHVLDGIHAVVYAVGAADHTIRSVNREMLSLLPDIRIGDSCYHALWNQDAPCDFCPIPSLSAQNPHGNLERYNDKMGCYLSIDSVLVNDEEDPTIVFTGYDITRRVESENRLKNMAYQDVQLGIKNRLAFMEELSEHFKQGRSGCACMLSLKNFNSYNVVYGRFAGDILLKDLTDFYTSHYDRGRIYRVGGAKLAFLADDLAQRECLQALLNGGLPDSLIQKNGNFQLYIDAAMLEFPQYSANPEMVMHNAEYLLSRNKKTESSGVLFFRDNEQEQMERRNQIASVIRRSLKEGKFQVYCQPICELGNGRFTKCEALLRLHDEKLGWISPGEFIPVAEESGLINDLGNFVLEEACRIIARRAESGLPPVQINVNVSTVQFSRNTFYEDVISTVEKYHIDLRLIQLEVTESIVINSFDYIVSIMKRLIDHGISFAVDDFGTGYSSLSYIGTLPVTCLKLDKSFVDKISESDVYVLIVKNVIEIAKGLKFKIVAEGVETQNQMDMLQQMGCDYIQGFLLAKPLSENDFDAFLEKEEKVC